MKVQEEPRLPADLVGMVRQLTTLFREYGLQINQLSEGRAAAVYNAQAAMPTSGTYYIGDMVQNSVPAILGAPGSRYILNGWRRVTNGAAHVLNTDWVEVRTLTGA